MNKTITILMILLLLPVVQAGHYSEIRELGKEFETPQEIHNYLWKTNNYSFHNESISLNKYWETRTGDCTEVARVEYIMLKAIGYKAKIYHGYVMVNGTNQKHDLTLYYEDYKWKNDTTYNLTKIVGRGIW